MMRQFHKYFLSKICYSPVRVNLHFSWPAVQKGSQMMRQFHKDFFLADMLFAEANTYMVQC